MPILPVQFGKSFLLVLGLHPNHRSPVIAPPSLWMAVNQVWATPVQWWSFYWAHSVALCV